MQIRMEDQYSLPEYKDSFSHKFAQRAKAGLKLRESKLADYVNISIYRPSAANQEDRVCISHQNRGSSSNRSCCEERPRSTSSSTEEEGEICPCYTCYSTKTDFSHDFGQHIDNSPQLLHKISRLYQNSDLSDIQIVVGPKVYDVHKLILCCSSDVFRVMLTNPSWPESNRNRIVLKEEPECMQVFEDFLKYLYTGEVHLTHYAVLPMLMLADKYNVCDLREVCIDYMCSHLVATVQHNHAVSWLQYANLCNHIDLAHTCENFIMWNFHKVTCTCDFLLMDKEVLMYFLKQSDMVISDEYTLFKGASRWLIHQRNRLNGQFNDFEDNALDVLSCIRFPMMTPLQLSQLERDPMARCFREFFVEKVVHALTFHSCTLQEKKNVASISGESDMFKPRNYTNDVWSTTLSIENFLALPVHDVRPLFFSTPLSAAQADENHCWEWNVDLFPKGIHFQKCIMIGLWRNLELSGAVYNTVRLVLETKTPERRNVEVAVLVTGVQDNVEFIKKVVQMHCMFDEDRRVCHLNDIVPYEELNTANSSYLSGPESNAFKVTIIIKPV